MTTSPVKSVRSGGIDLVELFGLQPGLVQRVGGKPLGQVELANDRQRVDARRARGPSTSMITPSPSW